MFMFFIIIGNLLVHLQALIKLHSEGAENKTFVFLAAWTIGLWNVFPIIFVLEKQYVLNHDQGQIIQVTLDILAKVSRLAPDNAVCHRHGRRQARARGAYRCRRCLTCGLRPLPTTTACTVPARLTVGLSSHTLRTTIHSVLNPSSLPHPVVLTARRWYSASC